MSDDTLDVGGPPPMTDKLDLEELKRLLAEATPGPWEVDEYKAVRGLTRMIVSKGRRDRHLATVETRVFPNDEAFYHPQLEYANAKVIVAAVNSLPALIARAEELEELRKENRWFRSRLLTKNDLKLAHDNLWELNKP